MWAVFSRIFCSLRLFERRRMNNLLVLTWTGFPKSLDAMLVMSLLDSFILVFSVGKVDIIRT